MRTRLRPNVVAVAAGALVALVAAPALIAAGYDSFPLSTYPMFAKERARVASVATVVVVGDDGAVQRLSSHEIGGTEEPMLAMETVANAVEAGESDALCAEVAGRVGAVPGRLQVVTERYDTLEWFAGDRAPLDRVVHATCEARS